MPQATSGGILAEGAVRSSGVGGAPCVSVITPTLNEEANIDLLIRGVLEAFADEPYEIEILVADGGSTDATRSRVQAWGSASGVRLVACDGRAGLAGDVLAAAAVARGSVVVVLDADLSHPPATARELAKQVLDDSCDMAIASRYVPGGRIPDWTWTRRVISRAATVLVRPLVDVRDPLSGFFAIRRDRLLAVDPKTEGFKIGLEALVAGGDGLRVVEVPISFYDRVHGESKIGMHQVISYLRRLLCLAGAVWGVHGARRDVLVAMLAVGVDIGSFLGLRAGGFGLGAAHILSFLIAGAACYSFNGRWALSTTCEGRAEWSGHVRFVVVWLLALFLRGGLLVLLMERAGWGQGPAILAAAGLGGMVFLIGRAFFVCPSEAKLWASGLRWRVAAVGLLGYAFVLRLIYMGLADLLPEEAYYWNYAQHLDLGYLDHPPMVAWLISLGTGVFGDTEFGVRIGSLVCWVVSALFCYGFARNIADRGTAIRAVLLVGVLPFFLVFGTFMTPDAPLTACWAGALYFLERALLGRDRVAGWGAGVSLGLGMLSKYTMALVCPAAVVFVLLDRTSRRWLVRPEPYAALLVAGLLFSPVIVWNAHHQWISFWFQGARRMSGASAFSLHLFVGSVLLLITPVGLIGVYKGLFGWLPVTAIRHQDKRERRGRLFMGVFMLVPLSVFAVFSLSHQPKLNWTGPVWLAALPMLAGQMGGVRGVKVGGGKWGGMLGGIRGYEQRLWGGTLATVLLLFGGTLHYVVLGLPGVGYRDKLSLPVAWEQLGAQVERLEDQIKQRTGNKPLVVGMDKYFLASELAFYRRDVDELEGTEHSTSRHLFDRKGLMYAYWFPPESQVGRTLVLVGWDRKSLADKVTAEHVDHLGPIQEQVVIKDGRQVAKYYYRVGYGYHTSNLKYRYAYAGFVGPG